MVFGLFRSKADILKEKIIFTQKNRIESLETEMDEMKRTVRTKDEEVRTVRVTFDRSKERLVEQIIELSDKFADINQRMLDMAHENARLKYSRGDKSMMLEDKRQKKDRRQ